MRCKNTISVTANGKSFTMPSEQTLNEFFMGNGLGCGLAVVELNGKAIAPLLMGSIILSDEDRRDVFRTAAGG